MTQNKQDNNSGTPGKLKNFCYLFKKKLFSSLLKVVLGQNLRKKVRIKQLKQNCLDRDHPEA